MSNFNTLFQSLIRSLKSLINKVDPTLSKPTQKFYLDAIFGILKSGSLVLNDIAFALNEDISLKKVNTRLYKNLEKIIPPASKACYIQTVLEYANEEELVFIVDDSDIVKPYGKAFEKLALVRDGSKKDSPLVLGYLLTSIVLLSKKSKQPIPIYNHIHNATEKNYKSTNNITNIGLRSIFPFLAKEVALFVFDRGYDDVKLMNLINANNQHFLIRMRRSRHIYIKSSKSDAFFESSKRKGKINVPIFYKSKPEMLKVSHIEAKINNYPSKITIVFIYSLFNDEPIILLSNRKVHSPDDLIRLSLNYISRWKIEELFRFKKVEFRLENFRVKSLVSINNLCYFLDVAILFLVHIIETKYQNKFYISLMENSKRIKEKVSIEYYQLYSGLKRIFNSNKKGVKNYKEVERWEYEELNLFNSLELTTRKRVRKGKIKDKKR
ncbi:MAG: transposase [Erysipelotrichia bacterium]|jgi:hypothetical protein|nr:transposase [Erysipelotrichia bacterium]